MAIGCNLRSKFLLASILIYFPHFITGQSDFPMANLPTSWTNNMSGPNYQKFADGSSISLVLLRGIEAQTFACGFFCNGTCESYIFAIVIFQGSSSSAWVDSMVFPQVVWAANPDKPVRLYASLQLQSDGDLVLKDVDGSIVWSTNTTGRSVAGLNLNDAGNLALFDQNKSAVWQSFDRPTDSLVPGQKLMAGYKLTASISDTNWTQGSLFSLVVSDEGLFAFLGSNSQETYFQYRISGIKENKEPSYIRFLNGSLGLYIHSAEPSEADGVITIPQASSIQYMKFGSDGHLRVYEWNDTSREWIEVADLLTGYLDACNYPTVCGENGICSNGQCRCPSGPDGTLLFRQINDRRPDLGCSEVTPLNCSDSQHHRFVEVPDITYYAFSSDIQDTNIDDCKKACLENCSCKAALFLHSWNSSGGDCYLPSQLFSLTKNRRDTHSNSSAFIKVQDIPRNMTPNPVTNTTLSPSTARNKSRLPIILGSAIGTTCLLFLLIGFSFFKLWKENGEEEIEEDYLDQVPGMPTRFSFEDLKAATGNFSLKLGEGGFGSVFEGTLKDGIRVAVKRLDGLGHLKKSFLAEVETIGSIHHVNLVRLIGFCAEKSHRLLVYEYMSNGSLDKWIYQRNRQLDLDWKCRKNIILDIAKGLAYLHEDCRQKIVHLDIKPQNILLDDNYNAKVSDFGLSKLIDRNQSRVVTTMRGTPGYLAPEWLSLVIAEKVDVYSFGVVVLETLCGKRILDFSVPEEGMHLIRIFQKKAEEGRLLDMVDEYSEDMQTHKTQVVNMLQVAAWCLQREFAKRPSMSVVVKVLEGVMDVQGDLDYDFTTPLPRSTAKSDATTPSASILSGPR